MSDFFAYDEDVSDASEEESKESEHSEGKFYVMFAGFSEELEEMLVKQRVYLLADDLDFVNDYTEEFHESKVRFVLKIDESEMKGYFSEPMMERKSCLEGEDFYDMGLLTKETSVPTCIGYAYYEVDLHEDNRWIEEVAGKQKMVASIKMIPGMEYMIAVEKIQQKKAHDKMNTGLVFQKEYIYEDEEECPACGRHI